MIFKISHISLIKPFLYMTKMSGKKPKYLEKLKGFAVKQAFSIIFREFQLPKIVSDLRVRL